MPSTVVVETVSYPAWWSGATSVKVTTRAGTPYSAAVANTELLPQGVSINEPGSYVLVIPWENVDNLKKES